MIQAIETRYAGCRFRSRLEARWAVFFNALKVRWQYEPEGFDLDGDYYLPDFYLPAHSYWIEIKPTRPDDAVLGLLGRFATTLRRDVFVGIGEAYYPYRDDPYTPGEIANYYLPIHPGGNISSHSWWIKCSHCSGFYLTVFGFGREACPLCGECNAYDYYDRLGEGVRGLSPDTTDPEIVAAYTAARSARFEHGEAG